jgi:hypothetical protein
MKKNILFPLFVLLFAILACGDDSISVTPTQGVSVFDTKATVYGFFPSPPELTEERFIANLQGIGEHGDVIMVMRAVPWANFIESPDAKSKDINELRDLLSLAGSYRLEPIFVIDPLNGLDRRQIAPLPPDLAGGDFSTPELRAAFKNFALRLVREFSPRYLGLASEINTYADAQPDDFLNYLSLYREVYTAIKAEAPDTQIFVTFQWDDLNNAIPFDTTLDGEPFQPKWDQIEVFEPELDVWAISSYPYVAFDDASEIPADYYMPLLTRTDKPLAVAEGGYSSRDIEPFTGTPQDQVGYLTAIEDQIGDHLIFWIYLILDDVNAEAYRQHLSQDIGDSADAILWFEAVGLRTFDGTPKPALETWDSIRNKP